MNLNWRGIFPAATTQFTTDEGIDIDATMRHLDAMVAAGVHGMIMLGTVGENCSLEYERKTRRHQGDGRARRAAACRCWSASRNTRPRGACRFAEAAPRTRRRRPDGAAGDGLQVRPARDDRPFPGRGQVDRSADHVLQQPRQLRRRHHARDVRRPGRRAAVRGDQGIVRTIRRRSPISSIVCGNRYTLFCGVDDLALESTMLGVDGWVSGLVNAFPAENRLLWDLVMAGRLEEARRSLPLVHAAAAPGHARQVGAIHQARRAECGFGTEVVRAPRLPLGRTRRSQILSIIRKAIETRPTSTQINGEAPRPKTRSRCRPPPVDFRPARPLVTTA